MRRKNDSEDDFLPVLGSDSLPKNRTFPFAFPRFAAKMMQKAMLEPVVDVFESGHEVIATIELPGVKKEEITLKVSPTALMFQTKKGQKEEHKDAGHYEYAARFEGYSRTVPLPARVASAKAKATYKNGVLEVRVPKEHAAGHAGKVRID